MKKGLLVFAATTLFYSIIFAQTNVGIGTSTPASKVDVKGNLTVGNTYSGTSAPANGAIIEGRVGIGTTSPGTNAVLDVSSTTKGMYMPRFTNAQRTALTPSLGTGDKGLLIFNTDNNRTEFWDGTQWLSVGVGAGGPPTGAAGGDLTGSYPSPTIAADAVTSAKILNGTISSADLATPAVNATNQIFNTLPVGNGGTGQSSLTSNGVVYGNGSGSAGITSAPSPGQVMVGNASGVPSFATLSGDISTVSGTGAVTIANSAVTYGKIQNIANNKLLGNTTGAAAAPSEISIGTGFNVTGTGPYTLNASGTGGTVTGVTGTAPINVASGTTTPVISLNSTSVSPNSYGSATTVPTYTVDAQGRLTAASNTTIAIPGTAVTSAVANATTATNFTGSLAGDVSGTQGATSVDKIKGVALGTTTATDKNILIANGSQWVSQPMSGDATISNTGVVTITGSGTGNGYIKNQTGQQASSNFNISSAGVVGTTLTAGTSVISPVHQGSVAASGTLTLSSTSNTTKGSILFGTSAYDEVNNRLAVGATPSTARLFVKGDGTNPIISVADASSVVKFYVDPAGKVGVGTNSPNTSLDVRTNDAIQFPSGTTLQRPSSPIAGFTRYNSDTKGLEYYDGTQWVSANMSQVPVGTIAPYGGASAPAGWLICDGSAVASATYPDLYNAIGSTYGGNSTTFNLPDLRGRTTFGMSGSAPFATLGATGGSNSVTPTINSSALTVDIAATTTTLPNHLHTVPGHSHSFSLTTTATSTGSESGHTHSWGGWWSTDNAGSVASPTYGDGSGNTYSDGYVGYWNANFPTAAAGDHTHWISGGPRDDGNGSGSGSNGQMYGLWADAGAYSSADPNYAYGRNTLNAGSHTHNVYLPNHRHWIQARPTGAGSAHLHSIAALAVTGTVGSGSSGDAAFNSGNPTTNPTITIDPAPTSVTGTVTSSAVTTTNPYQVITYIIKATNTSTASIAAVNIPTGTLGQTLYNNGSNWTATSNIYNAGGNVGVGSVTPLQKLEIGTNGGLSFAGTSPSLNPADKKLYSPADGDLEWMTNSAAGVHGFALSHQGTKAVYLNIAGNSYLNGGNVGIGTTAPNSPLTVRTATATAYARTASLANAIGDANFELAVGRGVATNASGDMTTQIGQAYNGGLITEAISFLRGGGSTDGAITISTNSAERIRILSSGNVGVGNTGPISTLHTSGTLTVGAGANANTVGVAQITTGGASPINNRLTYGTDGTGWKFAIGKNQSGTVTDQVTIQDNGNVGIGTTNPVYTLDVNGSQIVRSGLMLGTGPTTFNYTNTAGTVVNSYSGTALYGGLPSLFVNGPNTNGGGLAISDDGGFYDFNDAYVTFQGSTGFKIGNNGAATPTNCLFRVNGLAGTGYRPIYADATGTLTTGANGRIFNSTSSATGAQSSDWIDYLSSGNMVVTTGEIVAISGTVTMNNTTGSGNDRFVITVKVNGGSCATSWREITSMPSADHQGAYEYPFYQVWQANCTGTVYFSINVGRFDSDDTYNASSARILCVKQ